MTYVTPDESHGLRPALRMRLDKVVYDSDMKTFWVLQEVTAPTPATDLAWTGA